MDNTGEHRIKPISFYSFGRERLVSLKEGNVLKFFLMYIFSKNLNLLDEDQSPC